MLHSIIQLQTDAVNKLVYLLSQQDCIQKEFTFRAPTGSGKTHMMAELMNKMLENDNNLVFIVSSLSTSGLARQNYDKFIEYKISEFQRLDPYEILSERTSEQRISIDSSHNVYVLARDLYKQKSRLMSNNSLVEFLEQIKSQGKKIIWLKDECHIASNNLDYLKYYFDKVLNLSATPNSKFDVEISELDAINNKLIKDVEFHEEELEDFGIQKFLKIRNEYKKYLNINPCLIIQISNKDKGEEEWNKIKTVLDTKFAGVQYVCFANNPKLCDTNSDILKKIKINEWKNIVKDNNSLVSIIIFKMIIKEGYDIPRACMLYQVRDTFSETLDEQVIGRIRRNPILLDWKDYSEPAHNLALKAIVYGIEKKQGRKFNVAFLDKEKAKTFKVKTTILNDLWNEQKSNFNLSEYVKKNKKNGTSSIFELYKKWKNIDDKTSEKCWEYIGNSHDKWFDISYLIEKIRNENNNYKANYENSMELGPSVSFCSSVKYEIVNENDPVQITDWIWQQMLNNEPYYDYYFDSKAERTFTNMIKDCGYTVWGKNFYAGRNEKNLMCFQYIDFDDKNSFPDFIINLNDNIHIIEAKSLVDENNQIIDSESYKHKIESLKKAFKCASKLTKQCFYMAVQELNYNKMPVWNIFKYQNGKERRYFDIRTPKQLKEVIEKDIE